VPDFTIKGTVKSVFCDIDDAFEGELSVESSSVDIKSIEIQLVRIEQCEPQHFSNFKKSVQTPPSKNQQKFKIFKLLKEIQSKT
jgi:hypothetical protein